MVFSTFQFLVTTLLAVVCARAISLSDGDIPVLACLLYTSPSPRDDR